MSVYDNDGLVGLKASTKEMEYQNKLNKKVEEILGENESISFNELKKKSIFKVDFDNLDENTKNNIKHIISLEDGSDNVTEKELKVLLSAIDAKFKDFDTFTNAIKAALKDDFDNYTLDNNYNIEEEDIAIKLTTKEELTKIFNNTKTRSAKKSMENIIKKIIGSESPYNKLGYVKEEIMNNIIKEGKNNIFTRKEINYIISELYPKPNRPNEMREDE